MSTTEVVVASVVVVIVVNVVVVVCEGKSGSAVVNVVCERGDRDGSEG